MFVCDKCGLNHSYACVSKRGVNLRRGREWGWQNNNKKKSPCSHSFPLCCVFLLFDTVRVRARRTEEEDLTGIIWIPLGTTRLCVALVTLCHGNLLGLLLLLCFIVVFLRSGYLRPTANFCEDSLGHKGSLF